MKAEKFNVVRAKEFSQGKEKKTQWLPVGTLTKFKNGNMILEMNDRAETYQVFPFRNGND